MILLWWLSTQEASLKEIENVWTVFQNWKTGFGVHVNIVLKFIWPLIQRCLLVLFRQWREWMWSRRWASVSCTDSALSVLLPDSPPPAEVDTNYTYFFIVMQINFQVFLHLFLSYKFALFYCYEWLIQALLLRVRISCQFNMK